LQVFHVEFNGTFFSGKEFEEVGIETKSASKQEGDSKNDEENEENLPIMMEAEIGNSLEDSVDHMEKDYNRFIRSYKTLESRLKAG
jgi:hypothetical protein